MIQPLRRVHRWVFLVLAVALPAILFLGLEGRRPRAAVLETPRYSHGSLVTESDRLWRKHSIRTELYRDAQNTSVVLRPTEDLAEPDLLLYWAASVPGEDALPADARLLGTFNPGQAFALPSDGKTGSLVLYSLAHHSVLDTAALERTP